MSGPAMPQERTAPGRHPPTRQVLALLLEVRRIPGLPSPPKKNTIAGAFAGQLRAWASSGSARLVISIKSGSILLMRLLAI